MLTPLQLAEDALALALAGGLGCGGFAYAALWPPSDLFGKALRAPRNPQSGPPEIALTFDDGPHPRWTPMLLDSLAQHNVRATFFLVGRYAATQHLLVRRIHQAGHLIGNHTWTHPNLAVTGARQTRDELSRTSAELEQITGAPVGYFRPPFGARRPATLRIAWELGLTPVLWNAITADWNATDAAQITPRMSRIVDGNQRRGYATNLVLHDGSHLSLEANRSASVQAAGQLMERFGATHRFVALDEWREAKKG